MTPSAPDQFSALLTAAAAIGVRTETAMRSDLETALTNCDPLLVEVLHYALFNGGKRIRPLLTVLCSRCCGRDDDTLYLLASAFEYLHVATLAHDDVIDRADQRRGRPSVAARFGTTAAILAGDWLHARSMYLIGRLTGSDGLEIFSTATAAMVNGEFAQLRHIADLNTKQHHYFAVIRQKTSNLIASACSIGALYAGADTRQRDALTTYGDRIGAAFQVVDDLLDFKGETGTTGKKTGNDFIEGKMTLPLLLALDKASPEQRQAMKTLLEGDRSQIEALTLLHALIEDLDGFNGAARIAHQLIDAALKALDIFSFGRQELENVDQLRKLARFILARKK